MECSSCADSANVGGWAEGGAQHSATEVERPMRVLIDARKLGHGGIGRYIENLVTGLLECGGVQLTLIARPGQRDEYPFAAEVGWIDDDTALYSLRELFGLRYRISPNQFDLFHAPHYTLPFGVPVPTVVTVHDTIHVSHPERFYYPLIGGTLIRSAARRATHVITVSEHTRSQVLDLTGVVSAKVTHIPNAVEVSLIERAGAPADGTESGSRPAYFLGVFSTIKPHKGLPDLLAAYGAFRERYATNGECPELLLAGFGTTEIVHQPHVSQLARSTPGVRVLGSVSNAEMIGLYRQASCLVVPSLAEGFCLPALEAQAVGTPVVCRPVPALREIVSACDLVVDNLSVSALTEGLCEGFRRSLAHPRKVDMRLFERYAPVVVARQVRQVYHQVLSSRRSGRKGLSTEALL